MKRAYPLLLAIALPLAIAAADKPRIFVTESHPVQVSGDVSGGDLKGALSFSGGASPENTEVMKAFVQHCPDVLITADQDKAQYTVRLDHEPRNPFTPFEHGNKVAVFNQQKDLIYSGSTHLLGNAVRAACAAITGHPGK